MLLPVYIIKFASMFICIRNVKFKDYIFLGKLIMIIKIILFIVSFNTWLVSLKIGTKYIKHCFFTIITIELLPIVKFNPFFIQDDRKEAIGNSEIDHVCSCQFQFQHFSSFIATFFLVFGIQKLKLKNLRPITALIIILNVLTFVFNRC